MSNYVYAEAQRYQQLECPIRCHCNALEFFREVHRRVILDTFKDTVFKPSCTTRRLATTSLRSVHGLECVVLERDRSKHTLSKAAGYGAPNSQALIGVLSRSYNKPRYAHLNESYAPLAAHLGLKHLTVDPSRKTRYAMGICHIQNGNTSRSRFRA